MNKEKKIWKVYFKARVQALSNGHLYHVVAILRRKGKVIKTGVNSNKTHPRFTRTYDDGTIASHMHAEMSVLRYARPGDEIEVMRFKKCEHGMTMAKPCVHCCKFLEQSGVSKVRYTNWDGEWEEINFK